MDKYSMRILWRRYFILYSCSIVASSHLHGDVTVALVKHQEYCMRCYLGVDANKYNRLLHLGKKISKELITHAALNMFNYYPLIALIKNNLYRNVSTVNFYKMYLKIEE